ncbi:hypothetical protein L2E82_19589 [Cichorium intybus]|uniref:Uncharacterized protein n=1 Tax=Cichorium intybus TaxID=13427 RepID=A0ACB9FBL2_CICIN|nr:hypothetical protein L2E82_19589 [Cichorium intybus]
MFWLNSGSTNSLLAPKTLSHSKYRPCFTSAGYTLHYRYKYRLFPRVFLYASPPFEACFPLFLPRIFIHLRERGKFSQKRRLVISIVTRLSPYIAVPIATPSVLFVC